MKKSTKRWNVPVPEHLDEQLEKYIERDVAYKTKSEFIRTAVRDRLEKEIQKLEVKTGEEK